MKPETAQLIFDELEDGSLYENYSGRGMYGSMTTGVVVNEISDFIVAAVAASYSMGLNAHREPRAFTEFTQEIKSVKFDSMGKNFIFY